MLLPVANNALPEKRKKQGQVALGIYQLHTGYQIQLVVSSSWCLPAYGYNFMSSSLPDHRRAPLCTFGIWHYTPSP